MPHTTGEDFAPGRYRGPDSTPGISVYCIVHCPACSLASQNGQDIPPNAPELSQTHLQTPLNSKKNIAIYPVINAHDGYNDHELHELTRIIFYIDDMFYFGRSAYENAFSIHFQQIKTFTL